ncbi:MULTISPECIES: DUF4268 domain-containing protein [Polaribacter]|uniref:DUF4268 domain-containing protein n=1 Tax=Polaribacter marinaquae TaxID=1642819 RepID=A0ABZ2TRK0_9FLAO|nr:MULTISPECIES: DUF4268 domain-containing protein [unclassified Polaribacter]AQS93478.1 hypothetical protein BXQ17_04975 [Polaribacter sp. BM10]SHM72816.1 protein of unknown function [Polaribacter sp. KT 15]
MFSKAEAELIRKEFWTSFGKSFPKKWLLYNTKVKGLSFKFVADRKKAAVCLDIENPDELVNLLYYDQMLSLKVLLESEIPEVIFDDDFLLENGKTIHRIYVPFDKKFSIHNKNTWRDCYEFFVDTMTKFEMFFYEYEDVIKNI